MSQAVYFSHFLVTNQVFYRTRYSYALVNLKPLVPGHVLIAPLRPTCVRLRDLTPEEHSDYFQTLQVVHQFIQAEFKAAALNIAIQDGPEAGQTVPHLHTHLIPRYADNNIGDAIYDHLDRWSFEDQLADWQRRRAAYCGDEAARRELAKPDDVRKPRTADDMTAEARALSAGLQSFLADHPALAPK
ncbi:AAL053Cp [Eremothecium gossypii ATCC 10895]|uniref:Bis(5'-adenosyl)-triphosphatase n=1 Tax=Eremothecium gossypii (strain ATCC 10895 / CBS 109.51 / FGSC 9923 / NRRL Y-1056) TaxID=284811 RepID=Q75EY1_EREGS|nr:AAL053Cp [Eremothecium gossypii ATCC 10895]AAS50313.2 AAL053Cp [Eremothecium gossypii ATCC 10895]AEY94599.1 FAAL053Cp [Eremothecium gossypii FDAG1]